MIKIRTKMVEDCVNNSDWNGCEYYTKCQEQLEANKHLFSRYMDCIAQEIGANKDVEMSTGPQLVRCATCNKQQKDFNIFLWCTWHSFSCLGSGQFKTEHIFFKSTRPAHGTMHGAWVLPIKTFIIVYVFPITPLARGAWSLSCSNKNVYYCIRQIRPTR